MRLAALSAVALLLCTAAAAARAACVVGTEDPADGGCKRCSADGSVCEECWPSWGLSSAGACVQCLPPGELGDYCAKCSGDRPDFCLECRPFNAKGARMGHYADAQGLCLACPLDGCAACAQLTGECTSCAGGRGLVNGTCQACADPNCNSCDGDPARCTDCMALTHYANETGACVPCPPACRGCYNATTCYACGISYGRREPGDDALSASDCLPCAAPHCADCGEVFDDACAACQDGYGLGADGQCVQCPEACTACTLTGAAWSCEFCQEGHYLKEPGPLCTKCLTPDDDAWCASAR